MYFPATKIKILASSVVKKGAALRKGSLGYVTNLGGVYSSIDPSINIEKIPYLLIPGHIITTRFGNEIKRRSEIKPVVYVVPTQSQSINHSKLKSIDSLLEDASYFASHLKSSWKNTNLTVNKLPFIIALPTTEETSLVSNNTDFNAWVTSIFTSKLLTTALDKGSIGKGAGAALVKLLSDFLPSQQEFEWYKYFAYQKEIDAFLKTLPQAKKLQFITFLQGQRSIYIRNYLSNVYTLYGSRDVYRYALRNANGIDFSTPNLVGLYNLKHWYSVQKRLTLAWLDICYNLNIKEDKLSEISDIRKNINMWITKITTFK